MIVVRCYLGSHLNLWCLLLSKNPLVCLKLLNRRIGLLHTNPTLYLFGLCLCYKWHFLFLAIILRLLLLYLGSSNAGIGIFRKLFILLLLIVIAHNLLLSMGNWARLVLQSVVIVHHRTHIDVSAVIENHS